LILRSLIVGAQALRAAKRGEMFLAYQPKVNMATGRLDAVEALVRWRHPRHGLLPPDGWIGDVEISPFSTAFNLWVIDAAMKQANAWREEDRPVRVAVNLSPQCLDDPRLPGELHRLLRKWDLDSEAIELEVTERALETSGADAIELLAGVGIQLVLDDFGIGYSSLQRLVKLPLDGVKIDRSFVTGMVDNPRSTEVVRWAAELARGLGLTLAAEGVETRESWLALRALGVGSAQGYLIARPLSPEELNVWRREAPALV
jgi:EAL domain-containing protein (putative c-di-GMP-specific phosphodiesterase class I)